MHRKGITAEIKEQLVMSLIGRKKIKSSDCHHIIYGGELCATNTVCIYL